MTKIEDIFKQHEIFGYTKRYVCSHPELVGLSDDCLQGMGKEQRNETIFGEYLYRLSLHVSEQSSIMLKNTQCHYGRHPDWFDHRHHMMNIKLESKNSWLESAAMVLRLLPKGGKILNYCAGDAYYDSVFFSNMASRIDCVDINNEDKYKNYVIQENIKDKNNIKYIYEDVLSHEPEENFYDIVIMRSAIEHFSESNQIKLCSKIKKSLKPGGWFVGDTPANPNAEKQKHHSAHEKEWRDENEAKAFLKKCFDEVEVYTIHCNIDPRDTIFWKCR